MKTRTLKTTLLALTLSATLVLATDASSATNDSIKASAKPAATASAAKIKLVDINSANKDELKILPGVTDEVAARIIAGRPYLSKAHLLTRKIIDAGTYDNLRTLVVAKQKGSLESKPAKK